MTQIKYPLFWTALFLVGCKQAPDLSRTKSLDNFTSKDQGKVSYNSCSGGNAVTVQESSLLGNQRENSAIRKALSAVPKELQDAFFKDLQGSIAVVKDPQTACGIARSDVTRTDDLLACFRGGESGVTIFIKAESEQNLTERNIRHSVVRMMGYILTDVILKAKKSGSEVLRVDNPALADVKQDVADALTTDVKKSKDSRIPESIKADESKYRDAAFAEAFDSYYCSAQSQSTMSKNFPQTYSIFTEIAAILPSGLSGTLETSSAAADSVPSQSHESSDFSLWGRWGWGNGPFRQAFSNWGSWRDSGGGFLNFRRWNDGGGLFFDW